MWYSALQRQVIYRSSNLQQQERGNRVWLSLGKSVVLQLTERLNGSACRIFNDNCLFTLPSLLKKLTKHRFMELTLFEKTGNCYMELKREKRKFQKIRSRRKQTCWFMVLRIKARKLSIVETATFLSVKMDLSH